MCTLRSEALAAFSGCAMLHGEDSHVVVFELFVETFVVFSILRFVSREGDDRVVDLRHARIDGFNLDTEVRPCLNELAIDSLDFDFQPCARLVDLATDRGFELCEAVVSVV